MKNASKILAALFIVAFTPCSVYANSDADRVQYLEMLAANGDKFAQNELGERFSRGEGVPPNEEKAVELFQAAASQNHPRAQFNYAYMLSVGRGIPEDDSLAFEWFRKAALQGDGLAQFTMGILYAEGIGVSQDRIQAYSWLNIMASRGDDLAIKIKNWLVQEMTKADVSKAQALSAKLLEKIARK